MSFLKELREINIERQKEWDPDNKASLSFRGLEFAGEAGELASKIKKLARKTEFDFVGSDYDMTDIREEVGDVLITLDLVCNMMGIDIEEATKDKFNKTSEKVGLKTKFESFVSEYKAKIKNLVPHLVLDEDDKVISIIYAYDNETYSNLVKIYRKIVDDKFIHPPKFRKVSEQKITVSEEFRTSTVDFFKEPYFSNGEKLYAVYFPYLRKIFHVYSDNGINAVNYIKYHYITMLELEEMEEDDFENHVTYYVVNKEQATQEI